MGVDEAAPIGLEASLAEGVQFGPSLRVAEVAGGEAPQRVMRLHHVDVALVDRGRPMGLRAMPQSLSSPQCVGHGSA